MTDFHFKQAGVFHLQKIQHLVREITGHRYKLSSAQSMAELITQAIRIPDARLKEEFRLFYKNCWPCTQEYIASTFFPRHKAKADMPESDILEENILELAC